MSAALQPQVLTANEGAAYWLVNSLTTVKATSEDTGGAFGTLHQTLPPGYATPYHQHRTGDEAFYVLGGEIAFFSDGKKVKLEAGGYIFLPHGSPHGFRNESASPAQVLFLSMPCEEFLNFLKEAGEPATERVLPTASVPDFRKLKMLSDRYGVDVLGRCRKNKSVRAEVGELKFDANIFRAKHGHDVLQRVFIFTDDADGVALDAGLGLLL